VSVATLLILTDHMKNAYHMTPGNFANISQDERDNQENSSRTEIFCSVLSIMGQL